MRRRLYAFTTPRGCTVYSRDRELLVRIASALGVSAERVMVVKVW